MNKYTISIGVYFLLFFSMTTCTSDEDLGSDYYIISPYDVIDMGFPYGSLIYKSKNINLFSKYVIWSEVVNIKRTDRFILVKQNPDYVKFKNNIMDHLEIQKYQMNNSMDHSFESNMIFIPDFEMNSINIYFSRKNYEFSKSELDSILRSKKFISNYFKDSVNYFIIDKYKNTVTAPLSHEQFKKEIQKKDIDEVL